MFNKTSARRIALASTLGLTGVLLTASAASAHVSVSPGSGEAGSYAVLTFSVPHGCGDEATNGIAIQIPEGVMSVTPTVLPGWDVEKVMEKLDEPIDDGHGGQLTERVGEIVYKTDDPLADGYRAAFEVSVKLPETAGETVYFPVLQSCVKGESAWVQKPADGQDPHDLELPAPSVELLAGGGGHGDDADAASTEQVADKEGSSVASADSDAGAPSVVGWIALGLGVVGVGLGGTALLRRQN